MTTPAERMAGELMRVALVNGAHLNDAEFRVLEAAATLLREQEARAKATYAELKMVSDSEKESYAAYCNARTERDAALARATRAERLAHRLQHGGAIEGDEVCAWELRAKRAEAEASRYANAIGRIESALGIAGTVPFEQTIAAVERATASASALAAAVEAFDHCICRACMDNAGVTDCERYSAMLDNLPSENGASE